MTKQFTYALLAFFLLLGSNITFGQDKKNEPYQQKRSFSKISKSSYQKPNEATKKLKAAEKLFKSEPEKALDLVHDALLIAIKDNYLKEEADAYKLLGEFNYKLNEYNLSYKNYGKAIAIYNKQGFSSIFEIYYNIGKSAEKLNDYSNANNYYSRYLKLAKGKSNKSSQVKGHIALGDVYLKEKELKAAKQHYTEALHIEKKRDNKQGIVIANLKLGEVEEARNNDKQAIQYYRSSQNTAKQIEDDQSVNQAYTNISNIYENQRNSNEGIELNQEALDYNQKRNNQSEVAANSINLANFYIQQDNNELAIQSLQNSIEISDKTGDIANKSRATQVLSEAYNKSGLAEEAEKKYKEYLILEDSLYKMRERQLKSQNLKGEMLENAQNKLSLLEKDKQLSEKTIELLRQEKLIQEQFISEQKVLTYSLILGLIVLIITAFLVYRSNKAKNKANQLLVLKSLRAQMNPHFIFNALNSVNSFISKSDERAANRYLADFSRLMRDVMENSQEDFISLAKEIDILSMYLKLEHHRFNDKFDYSFEVDESINTEEFFIPPMLIQPYIENAVWHGLRYKKEKGFLKVSINQSNKTITVTIIDDGIGREKSQELKTENQKIQKSTGLKNIDSRLKIISDIYKAKLDVEIKDNEPTGTVVTVKILQENFIKKDI
ncbi:MAG: histidine kinase [Vicingaceae bacterium]|nr:histidine kinase [Vicingaceae bacterium]